ncbi:MAG: hypothetical protein L0H15_04540 [Nitrosospira sp.]|nr:hypothetical protein [Nitrosospira sp.]MDN5882404.1 hypothetical protein [Nitrosospira sp.]
MRFLAFAISFALVFPTVAHGDGFDIFGRQDDLKMAVIADVGEAEKIDAPLGKLGANDRIEINGRCFEPVGSVGYWRYGRKAAFVVVDQAKSLKIAILENGIGSIKVDVISVIQIDCSASASGELPSDPEKMLEILRKRQEVLQQELDRLKSKK